MTMLRNGVSRNGPIPGRREMIEDPGLAHPVDQPRNEDQRHADDAGLRAPDVPAPHYADLVGAHRRRRSGCRDPAPPCTVPTSGSTCQQRSHFSPSASSLTTPMPSTSSSMKAPSGGAPVDQRAAGRDRDLGQIDAVHGVRYARVLDIDLGRGLQAGADPLLAAFDLERAGDDAAQARTLSHFSASASSRHSAGMSGNSRRCTLSSRDGKRVSQASSAVKHRIGASQAVRHENSWSSTVRAARRRTESVRIAIERVLADVEIEGRQVHRAEVVELR